MEQSAGGNSQSYAARVAPTIGVMVGKRAGLS